MGVISSKELKYTLTAFDKKGKLIENFSMEITSTNALGSQANSYWLNYVKMFVNSAIDQIDLKLHQ